MSPSIIPLLIIILLNSFIIHLTECSSSCKSIYVTVEHFGHTSADNWNGIYSIDDTRKSFNASIWRITTPNSNQYLKYIETHWVLSGQNNELLIYESDTLSPPINQTTTWIHEFETDTAQVTLDCSASLSPTTQPTPAPTTQPTYSPTISRCDVLIVTDSSGNNINVNETYFDNWKYYRLATNDNNNRPMWQYIHNNIESFIQFLSGGWIVFLNDGTAMTTYASDKLFGNYPPLNRPVLFNITTNGGLTRIFTFVCLATDTPSNAPSTPPTTAPSYSPVLNPSIAPTHSPNEGPMPPPTMTPVSVPTIAPSIGCDVLKINVPHSLIINNNEQCDIDFNVVFSSYWLKQISRSNRPSWTLDCNDANDEYTKACQDGYSGSVFYISNQWEIQIHSKKDDCFERFIVDNTGSFFIPTNKKWIDQSTFNTYSFTIMCADRVFAPTPKATGGTLVSKKTVYIYDEVWFWIAFILILLICCLLCVGAYYWNKQRKPVMVYQAKARASVPSVSRFSMQKLELQNAPGQAYVDEDIADIAPQNTSNTKHGQGQEHEVNKENELKSKTVYDGAPNVTGDTVNPNVKNQNLKQYRHVKIISAHSRKNIGGELKLKSHHSGMSSADSNIEELYNNANKPVNTDQALEMIAGDRQATGYNAENDDENIANNADFDEIFNV